MRGFSGHSGLPQVAGEKLAEPHLPFRGWQTHRHAGSRSRASRLVAQARGCSLERSPSDPRSAHAENHAFFSPAGPFWAGGRRSRLRTLRIIIRPRRPSSDQGLAVHSDLPAFLHHPTSTYPPRRQAHALPTAQVDSGIGQHLAHSKWQPSSQMVAGSCQRPRQDCSVVRESKRLEKTNVHLKGTIANQNQAPSNELDETKRPIG